MENSFFEQFKHDLWVLGNNHYYGFNTESFEERGNELLKRTKEYLSSNENIDNELKQSIKCQQFWLLGFLAGQKIKIYEENCIEHKL